MDPKWRLGLKQSSLNPIARVLRYILVGITALTACLCPFELSLAGKPLTQEPSSKFFLVAPGILSCATWRTRATLRVPCGTGLACFSVLRFHHRDSRGF